MKALRKSAILSLLAFTILAGAVSCQSSKKALAAANAAKERERLAQEAALRKQKEAEEAKWKELEAKAKLEAERAEAEKRAAEEKHKDETIDETARLSQYFEIIVNSSNVTSANNSINEALAMFASSQTPVLIVISEENGTKDYDRPTTIEKYLNYLKDQKKNMNKVSDLKVNASGKITQLELRKNM